MGYMTLIDPIQHRWETQLIQEDNLRYSPGLALEANEADASTPGNAVGHANNANTNPLAALVPAAGADGMDPGQQLMNGDVDITTVVVPVPSLA